MNSVKKLVASRIKIARIFFILSAIYGLILRFYHISNSIPIAYKNILQAHSHVTFLGWGFLAVISLVGLVFYPDKLLNSNYLKTLFKIMTLTLFGMLISFPLQGYKLFSILFLSVFLITSYLYLIHMLSVLNKTKALSVKYIKTGIIYYFISSIAIWAVAIITVNFGKTDLYFNAVYFYLHFLYNGFFVFILFGLLIKYFENNKIEISQKHIKIFYLLTNIALVPAYVLSLLWNVMPDYIYYIGYFAVTLQLISLCYLNNILKVLFKSITSKHVKNIAYFVMLSYFLKVILQFFSAFPKIIEEVIILKSYFVIGYLHLFTLGFMSLFIILMLKLHPKKNLSKLGVNFLMFGIFLSEVLLFLQGGMLYTFNYGIQKINIFLFIASVFMPLGLIIIHIKLILNKKGI